MTGLANPLAPRLRRINITQGETRVSDAQDVILTTVLGSCISACLFDPLAKVGGLNHFLLAEPGINDTDTRSMQRYGVYAMEVLINGMLSAGGRRERLRARLYGGASMRGGFRDIGADNAAFARRFLRDERIELVDEDTGGHAARRIEFHAARGMTRCRTIRDAPIEAPKSLRAAMPAGDVELF